MPTSNIIDVNEYQLDELTRIAPQDPQLGTDWENRREDILQSIVTEPAHTSTPRRWGLAAVAAAAVVAVGGTGLALSQHQDEQIRPAAPVSSPGGHNTSVQNAAAANPVRVIPAGQYVVQRFTMTQYGPGSASDTVTRVDFKDSQQVLTMRMTVKGSTTTDRVKEPVRDLRGLPTDPAAMRAWFLKRDAHQGVSQTPEDVVWTASTDLMRDLGTSTALRQQLVGMLRVNPSTTIQNLTFNGHRAVRVTFVEAHRVGSSSETGTMTQSVTLDATSMAELQETQRLTNGKGSVVMDYVRKVTEPEHLTSTKP